MDRSSLVASVSSRSVSSLLSLPRVNDLVELLVPTLGMEAFPEAEVTPGACEVALESALDISVSMMV